jgi:hypothetical protein
MPSSVDVTVTSVRRKLTFDINNRHDATTPTSRRLTERRYLIEEDPQKDSLQLQGFRVLQFSSFSEP